MSGIKKNKILIVGGSGLLGVNWAVYKKEEFDVAIVAHNRNINLAGVDVIKIPQIGVASYSDYMAANDLYAIINCAAVANVEQCENDPSLAKEVNVDLAYELAKLAQTNGIKFVHISTDHLFDGRVKFVDENVDVRPQNVYALTKAQAEKSVLECCPDALIIRTNFFGWGTSYRQSFSDTIIKCLRSDAKIALFDDVYVTPVVIPLLIDTVHELLRLNTSGIFNIVGNERITKFDFGLMIADSFHLDSRLIINSKLSTRTDLVSRPYDMSLSNRKLEKKLGIRMPDIKEQFRILKRQETDGYSTLLSLV